MTGSNITRVYGNFRGVDFRDEDDNLARSPDSLNVWRDYSETESIRTRPGYSRIKGINTDINPEISSGKINSMYFTEDKLYVHSGTAIKRFSKTGDGLYDFDKTLTTSWLFPIADVPSKIFSFDDTVYILGGGNFWYVSGDAYIPVSNIGYVPTTSIGRKAGTEDTPSGGSTLEDVNMLSDYRKNTFLLEGASQYAWLDTKNIEEVVYVKVGDTELVEGDDYSVDLNLGRVHILYTIPEPSTDGQDNVEIEFMKTNSDKAKIGRCTLAQIFDNRIFFSGNPYYPNMVWHCSLNDPTYCSDLDYYQDGAGNAAITGLVASNDGLWVLRESSPENTTIFYHKPTLDGEYGKIYPSQHSNIATGCVGPAINFNDDIVFFSDRGMEAINGAITSEQVLAHRSSLVDGKLITHWLSYSKRVFAEWEGYLLVFVGNNVFLADSRKMFANENHYEYEWFYWKLGTNYSVNSAAVHDGKLYIGTDGDGVYVMEKGRIKDDGKPITSYWTTPKDRFSAPQMQKTTNKRGCVVEATGDIDVYAKTEDTDFELIGSYENVTDYFVSRIKRKKFKDIQLKFSSRTRFSLESATLECFVGGYIKR